jgi:hypothetical protein
MLQNVWIGNDCLTDIPAGMICGSDRSHQCACARSHERNRFKLSRKWTCGTPTLDTGGGMNAYNAISAVLGIAAAAMGDPRCSCSAVSGADQDRFPLTMRRGDARSARNISDQSFSRAARR